MSRLSLEYVFWPLVTTNDLSQVTSEVALLGAGVIPQETDWLPAVIFTEGINKYVRLLVGPGGDVTLAPGTYQSWIRLTANPERPVRRPGVVTIE
jgi:hypothetical protein